MATEVQALLARMAAQREAWADLGGGKKPQYRRPPEVELPRLMGGVGLEHVTQYACGWEGFTEADLLGAGIGGSDAVPFHRDLWAAYAADHAEDVAAVSQAMAQTVTVYLQRKADVAKNSQASST